MVSANYGFELCKSVLKAHNYDNLMLEICNLGHIKTSMVLLSSPVFKKRSVKKKIQTNESKIVFTL